MRDLKISKELLCEVLKTDEFTCDNIYGNIACLRDGNGGGWDYNLYEFAFRCKERAFKKGYDIHTNFNEVVAVFKEVRKIENVGHFKRLPLIS